jgi:hypothetical protein
MRVSHFLREIGCRVAQTRRQFEFIGGRAEKICSRESDVTGNFRFAGKNRKRFAARPIAPGKVGKVGVIVYFSEKTRKKEERYFFRSRTTAR